jgi:hypothetical protein
MAATFNRLRRRLNELPRTVAASVAARAAPALTVLTRQAYDGGRDVYGQSRPKSTTTGEVLTLNRTGATERTLKFVSVGTLVRCVLGTRYAKYLIGKYRILPNGPIPVAWRAKLDTIVQGTKAP